MFVMSPRTMFARLLLCALPALVPAAGHADVTDASADGFTSVHTIVISGARERVWQALTAEIGRWWDARHSYSGVASNFSLDARAGGCFCEALPNGGGVEHLRVVFVDTQHSIRLAGGLGPLQSMGVAGSMEFALEDGDRGATRLEYRYTVGGYYPGGLDTVASAVDLVQLGQLQRLKRFVETGAPEPPGST
jgi:uncharacterized protein YndB with AHSA1/START domain